MANLTITPELLASTGIQVPDDQIDDLLDYMNDVLEERVGEAVVELLDDDELEELVVLQENGSDANIHAWIQTHITDLDQVIQDEIDILLGESSEHQEAFSVRNSEDS